MYACSFSWRSSAPATIGHVGVVGLHLRARPSGAATTHTNTMSAAPASFT